MTKQQIRKGLTKKGYEVKDLFGGKVAVYKDGIGKVFKNYNQAKERYLYDRLNRCRDRKKKQSRAYL